jgi:FtsP/CotA-like multicopper oxidase with cupredoxin domain
MPEGKKVTVDVVNNTHLPELVHWHGFHISPEMDGTHEECAPHVQAGDSRRYSFTAQPASTRWYHIHGMAGQNTRIGMCSGQFGMVIVEPSQNNSRRLARLGAILQI